MAVYRDQPRIYNADVTAIVPRGKLYFFEPSSSDPKDAYADVSLASDGGNPPTLTVSYGRPHPNPLIADEAARMPPIYLNGAYRVLVTDQDSNEIIDLDPIPISDGVALLPGPNNVTPLSENGKILPFAVLTFYRSKTTMLEGLDENPITADMNGEFAEIDIEPLIAYRVVLNDADGVLIYDVDPYITGLVTMGAEAPLNVNFSIFVSANSNGPVGRGSGTGYYDGQTNGGITCGTIIPDPTMLDGVNISACAWEQFMGSDSFLFVLPGIHDSLLTFTSLALGVPANLTFLAADASFSTSEVSGFSIWRWPDTHVFDFIGQTLPVVIS